jgi:choloylglycine hydrolase
VNEKGLGIAGLSFPGNAVYLKEQKDKENISPFELIPWILGQCESVREAREYLMRANLVPIPFDETLPLTALHFMLSDAEESIVIEPTEKGIILHHNPVKVLTNNPPFLYQLQNLNSYMSLSRKTPMNHFAKELPLESYSRGMGALGLPGDLSSTSRFVKAAFVKWNSLEGRNEMEDVNQFFHILGSVEQPRGSVELHNGMYELTRYSSCCNTTRGIYYYKTYENSRITAVDMRREDLEGKHLIAFPMRDEWSVKWEN